MPDSDYVQDVLIHEKETDSFCLFPSYPLIVMHMQKPGLDLQSIANHPGFKFEADSFPSLKEFTFKKVFGKIPKTINYLSSIITNLQQHQLPLK